MDSDVTVNQEQLRRNMEAALAGELVFVGMTLTYEQWLAAGCPRRVDGAQPPAEAPRPETWRDRPPLL